MTKVFKKNQRVLAVLPTGRVVEGVYIEPYGATGHSFYANEYEGEGRDGKPIYSKKRYGVQDESIEAVESNVSSASFEQYKAWLKRASDLEAKIEELSSDKTEKNAKKIERYNSKLSQITAKITEYEDKMD